MNGDTIKLWSKRIAFWTACIVFAGLLIHTWDELGLPVPATASDINRLSKGQAEIGIKQQSQEERRLRSEIRELQFRIETMVQEDKTDPNDLILRKIYIRDLEELTIQLEDEKQLRIQYKNRIINLEREGK